MADPLFVFFAGDFAFDEAGADVFAVAALLDFAALDFAGLLVLAALPVLAAADFLAACLSTPAMSPTASAATFRAVTAAPVAAPVKISPATSLALLNKLDEDFFPEDVFLAGVLADDLDLLAVDLDVADLAELFAPELLALEVFELLALESFEPLALELFAVDLAVALAAGLSAADFLAADLPSSFLVGILFYSPLII